ncbi:hypothetical protein HYALB_00003873 [Hymenoscyphus albidus]|uniref:2EXR domain-containing protein n=1 Tax=Hymenoscyphus albidus TaxID=595503 RepID=A0A9N9LU37_9HELO|nr:hypothetical protein HYALB_00003873 [Hymenoscyphus albidus]
MNNTMTESMNPLQDHELKATIPTTPPPLSFSSLPPGIRHQIWRFSLPGPRTLVVSPPTEAHDISFSRIENHPAPPALFVCHESRQIALTRYRLVFGHPNQFADLPGGDILYFSPDGHWKPVYK